MSHDSTERSFVRPPAAAEGRASSLAPARLREVLDRLQAGYYDGPEVVRHVAERVAREMEASG